MYAHTHTHTHTHTHRERVTQTQNIILMGDFNIDIKNKGAGFEKLN